MRTWALSSLLGLAGLASLASGCGDTSCGAGTTLVDGVCTASGGPDGGDTGPTCGTGTVLMGDECVSTAMLSAACGANQTFDTATMKCKLQASGCAQGTQLNPTGDGCIKAVPQGSLIFAATADRIWNNLRYQNGNSLAILGDATTVTAAVADSAPIYLGGGQGGPGQNFNAATEAYFRMGKRPDIPAVFSANFGNPSTTPVAIDHQITVGEWRKCTMNWAVYINPPSNTATKKLYRIVVDFVGCPPDLLMGLWFNYNTGKYLNTRVLGPPAGGLPHVVTTLQDGTAHWERDIDPNLWTKSGIALNGNTHGAAGKGTVPDLTVNPDASFTMAAFVHNDQQSNGNAGWCMADPNNPAVCGLTDTITTSNFAGTGSLVNSTSGGMTSPSYTTAGDGALTTPWVRPYLLLPGKVGFDSVSAFGGGGITGVSTNTMPLSMLQPY